MTEENLQIVTIEDKGDYRLVVDSTGQKYGCWKKDVELKTNAIYTVDYTITEKNGTTYRNIQSAKFVKDTAAPSQPQGQVITQSKDVVKQRLKDACEIVDDVLRNTQEILEHGKLDVARMINGTVMQLTPWRPK